MSKEEKDKERVRRERSLRPLPRNAVPKGAGISAELAIVLNRSDPQPALLALVEELRTKPGNETVAGSRRANTGYFASAKVGRMIRFNSRNYEYPTALTLEFLPGCIAYFAQPGPFPIERTNADGIVYTTRYTPDYVAFLRVVDPATRRHLVDTLFIQCKSEDELREHPELYTWSDGHWHDYDAERMFAECFGARHEIWTDPNFNETLIQNLRVLRPRLAARGEVPDDIREKVVRHLRAFPAETITRVRRQFRDVTADHIHELILQGSISARLDRDRLDYPDTVRLFACAAIALVTNFPVTVEPLHADAEIVLRIGVDVRWHGRQYRIGNIARDNDGVEQIGLNFDGSLVWMKRSELLEDAKARQFEVLAPPEDSAMTYLAETRSDAAEALLTKNMAIANRLIAGGHPATRQERRIAEKIRNAKAAGEPIVKLLRPRLNGRGWFGVRMPDRDAGLAEKNELLLKASVKAYADDEAGGTLAVHYAEYVRQAKAAGCTPVSDETFRRRTATIPRQDLAETRLGHRAANAVAPSHRSASVVLIKAPRSHGLVLVDHTKFALMLVAVRGNHVYNIGRAWLTLGVCSYSTKIMNYVLLCDAPSQATLQLFVRDYRDRYGRLPDGWGHDNGPEFGSWFWMQVNSAKTVDLHTHPVVHARFGSEVELKFGSLDARLWNNILGGTKAIANRRRMTRKHDPQRLTPWTLRDASELIEDWIETHNNLPLAGISETPNQLYERSLDEVGRVPDKEIAAGLDWDAVSFQRPNNVGTVTVRRGEMRVKGVPYTSPELEELPDNSSVDARYDAFNRGAAIAYVNGIWRRQKATERFEFLNHISERDRRYASLEATKVLGKGCDPEAYAEFMAHVVEKQTSLRALRSGEQRMLLDKNGEFIDGTPAPTTTELDDNEQALESVTFAGVARKLAFGASNG